MLEITLKGDAKEIAALVLAVQERPGKEISVLEMARAMNEGLSQAVRDRVPST